MVILVAGFQPFGANDHNPSAAIARALDGQEVEGIRFVACGPLPVVYGECASVAIDAARRLGADVIVAFGLSTRSRAIKVEQVARNRCTAGDPDNAGTCREGEPIEAAGPALARTTIDAERVVAALDAAGIACSLSEDAGGYVCNDLYYRLLRAQAQGTSPAVLFLHVPQDADRSPQLPGALARALAIALAASVRSTRVAEEPSSSERS